MDLVEVLTPECKPPNIPAIHNGLSPLHIIKSESVNSLSTPSKEVNFVPFFNVVTSILLLTMLS